MSITTRNQKVTSENVRAFVQDFYISVSETVVFENINLFIFEISICILMLTSSLVTR